MNKIGAIYERHNRISAFDHSNGRITYQFVVHMADPPIATQ